MQYESLVQWGDGCPLLQLKVKPLVNDSYVGQTTMMDCPSGLCATRVSVEDNKPTEAQLIKSVVNECNINH